MHGDYAGLYVRDIYPDYPGYDVNSTTVGSPETQAENTANGAYMRSAAYTPESKSIGFVFGLVMLFVVGYLVAK